MATPRHPQVTPRDPQGDPNLKYALFERPFHTPFSHAFFIRLFIRLFHTPFSHAFLIRLFIRLFIRLSVRSFPNFVLLGSWPGPLALDHHDHDHDHDDDDDHDQDDDDYVVTT